MPSWFTYTQARLSGLYCAGTYTQYSRQVPGNILEPSNVNFNTSPFGTPACSMLAESTGYFSAGACAYKKTGGKKLRKSNIFFIRNLMTYYKEGQNILFAIE
jgi:hypothetical protein